ncbi:EAL domain-containing protein [Noviherbaspirillum sp. DKR-6]|uniref:EAL domain-containing protein n=2 Tax=Noviherbaspirillum pedocola TaxID=2801341 RepID=A0A934W618_9BURK|nr:EAL domain-containing protein [Noviherbaspirillum pedocola]
MKPKVLLVNDHPASLVALESLLLPDTESAEYEVVSAISGAEALRQVLQHQFAVILLDVSMPGMDGFETADLIHSHPRCAMVPIIFVTAHYADELHRLKAYQRGAVDYLFTPVIPRVLQNKVAVFVELAKKNLLLQRQAEELAELNRDLQVQRLHDLKRINAALEAEIVERRQAEERAHGLATRDALTGLYNRRSLIERLEQAIARANRTGNSLALLFLDMDRFKTINDTLGHDVGDELLIQVARRISGSVRESDVVARLGGDEFVVLMEDLPDFPDAAAVARKIVQANSTPCEIGMHSLKTSVSIGISLFPQDGATVQSLMKNADLAMYHAKQQRRGTIQFFHEELNARVMEKVRLERELQQALAAGQFELYYQPKVDITTGRIVGLEALLRWNHPRLGLVSSGQFLDGAADSGLLVPIGHWVLSSACAQAQAWRDHPQLGSLPIAINIAVPQMETELASTIRNLLREHNLAPRRLQLEITESLLMRDIEKAGVMLGQLNEAGLTLAIDDFGSGYSSLSVLKSLPVDILKIDQSFVRDLGKSAGDTAIVAAVVSMARALALRVVAEGVESREQLDILRSLGCDEYQGYHYCKPLPPAALEDQLVRLGDV